MSGGHFNYIQNTMEDAADEIHRIIESQTIPDDGRRFGKFSKETIAKLEIAKRQVAIAAEMLRRVDWLVSSDDGEDSSMIGGKKILKNYKKYLTLRSNSVYSLHRSATGDSPFTHAPPEESGSHRGSSKRVFYF